MDGWNQWFPDRLGRVRLADLMGPRQELEASADPLRKVVDRLVHQYDPGGYRLSCPVAGCRWTLDVPRMELDPEPLDPVSGDYVVRAEGVPREDVELVLRTHLDWHAVLSETGAQDVPLPAEPVA